MPNAVTHRLGAALAVGTTIACIEKDDEFAVEKTLVASGIGYACGTLPDILEPALNNPDHRQFFHSIGVLGLAGYGFYRAFKWEPESLFENFLRIVAMGACGAYAVHLLMDARTPKGLPLI